MLSDSSMVLMNMRKLSEYRVNEDNSAAFGSK